MQDISLLPGWNEEDVMQALQKNPLDSRTMKNKMDRIYQISYHNESEYISDVLDAYCWIKLGHCRPDFRKVFPADKHYKYFIEEFIPTTIRHMIICQKFKIKVMMVLTQQIMVESLSFFQKNSHLLEKYPKMTIILKNVFDVEKNFYKINYINNYIHFLVPISNQDISKVEQFIEDLKLGQQVDVLKSQPHSRRICWLPAKVIKINNLNIHVRVEFEKGSCYYNRKTMQIMPEGKMKQHYQWRINLKQGDQVDFEDKNGVWKPVTILERRETEDKDIDDSTKIIDLKLSTEDKEVEWVNLADPRIIKFRTFTKEDSNSSVQSTSDMYNDDFNDIIFDPEMTSFVVFRPRICQSHLLIDLLKYAQEKLQLFTMIEKSIKERKYNIEVTSQLINFILHTHSIFHRKFALTYMQSITDGILQYINKSDEMTIRNFSKQKYETIINCIKQFLKKLKPISQRRAIIENFQLQIILRFLFSNFLDRKLHAVSILTNVLKMSKHGMLSLSRNSLLEWINEHKILPAIYNEKSHSQLITRSTDFMQLYLLTKPTTEQLMPLLQWNQAIIKLVSQRFEYFPKDFQINMVQQIKKKENVINKDALNIIKKVQGCENWLLKNGGESWVDVVKDKTKRKADIDQVFKQPFDVVQKITKQVSDLYECRFRNEYFIYMNEINYVAEVFKKQDISVEDKIDFAALALYPLSSISSSIYDAILPYTRKINDKLAVEYQQFFVNLLYKLQKKCLLNLFETNFSTQQNLQSIGQGQMKLFQKCFLIINEEKKNIDKKIDFYYPNPNSYKKQKRQILIIKVNPNQLLGIKQLMTVIFQNKNISVTQEALQFIGFLFDHLATDLLDSALTFRSNFLQSCLQELYKTQDQQEKYLKIINKLINQSEKQGCDRQPSVSALFPLQYINIRIIDHFNVTKNKFNKEVPSNWTLYELRAEIGRIINAYVNQFKIVINNKKLDSRLNGYAIHTLDLSGDLIIEKIIEIDKVPLTDNNGGLSQKIRVVLKNMFKEYSQLGLMSRSQCQKYHQRCVGEVVSVSESKVDKIYDQYDKDEDGYLTEQDFLLFYESSVKLRQNTVWNNLQTFGMRNDLQILTGKSTQYPQPKSLTRNLLFSNEKFISLLFKLLRKPDNIAQAAWQILSRLPLKLQTHQLDNDHQSQYTFRYWLYLIDNSKRYKEIDESVVERIMNSDTETMCIGLKVAHECACISIELMMKILNNLKEINTLNTLQFYNKVILDNSLSIIQSSLKNNPIIKQHFIQKHEDYDQIFTSGLMGKNPQLRKIYCRCVERIIQVTVQDNFPIFEIFFNLLYKNFEKCEKSTLNIEYFDIYCDLLEMLRLHPQLLQKLKLNWLILTKSMIELYKQHQCTQMNLNSKPDQVAQGFLRIIRKLLDKNTVYQAYPLVRFIFQNSLFPENGHNKLKNAKSRKDAYELIYQICNLKNQEGQSVGLKELFDSGFKQVYKKMSHNKNTYSYSSYFYNYNEARSELGYAGIRNLGCICYMISMLQQLFMTKAFKNLILMADDGQPICLAKKGNKELDDNIFHQLKNMFAHLQLTEKQDYNPDEFCFSFKDWENMPINVSIQQDAQEFLNLFFDKMQNSLKNTPFLKIFQGIFGGKTCNQTVCCNCKTTKQMQENFYTLSLQIKGYRNIEESLKKHIAGELISDYQCEACNTKTDVTRSCYLSKLPNYFIIHLKRMCFNYEKQENEKINSRWQFPLDINFYDYTIDKLKAVTQNKDNYHYQLKGIVVHYGSADFGHYFSYIRQSDEQWIQFNDQRVRQFDPRDIQMDCFGGQNWRRQSQSAYLLVYEKVQKTQIELQFNTDEEKNKIIKEFNLQNAIIKKVQVQQKEKELEKQIIEEQTKSEQPKKEDNDGSEQKVPKKQVKKIPLYLDLLKIPNYVSEDLRTKINKSNEQFSFTINLSNDEFAYFIFKILSIDPPESLSTEYLELCYECFHLKQIVDQTNNTTLSEWAAQRFKEIISGHGWEFLKIFGQNWEVDILSTQRATRVGAKNLLECVIGDIIKSNRLNEEEQETQQQQRSEEEISSATKKRQIILHFLDKFLEMLRGQVARHWHRFKEYFDVWMVLINENRFVRRYAQEKMMVESLLDFILEDDSPFSEYKKYSIGSQHYPAQFDHPLEVINLLIKHGYQLNQMEKKCTKKFAFINKIVNFPTKHFNMIDYISRNNQSVSQKVAFIILTDANKVSQSDSIKPIISAIHQFFEIDDQIRPKRKQWILGIPQYVQNQKTGSYGIYGINPEQQMQMTYGSPIRQLSILQQLIRFRHKSQHISALLVSMLLQLQVDGHINNLEQYESLFAFKKNYIYWFDQFVDSYFNETRRPYMMKHYIDYGNRIKNLWKNRPNRPYIKKPKYLIGKTLQKDIYKHQTMNEVIDIEQVDIKSSLLPLNEQNCFLNRKNIKNFTKTDNFKIKSTPTYNHSTFLPIDRSYQSSDDDEKKPVNNPFEQAVEGQLFRKVNIHNKTNEGILITLKLEGGVNCNCVLPVSELSFQIAGDQMYSFTLMKCQLQKQFGDIKFEIKVMSKITRDNYWPKQLINVLEDQRVSSAKNSSDEDSGEQCF